LEEAKRFLRYGIPGLIMMIEFLGYLLISGDICFSKLIEWVKGNNVGIAVSAFLASGGLGFLLGVIYYTFVWQEEEPRWILNGPWRKTPVPWLWRKAAWLGKKLGIKLGADFHRVLEKAVSKTWLKLLCYPNGKEVQATKLTKRGVWRILTSYLAMRMETSLRIKGAFPRMERFANLVHGLGTTYLGSFVALVSFLCVNIRPCEGQFSLRGLVSFGIGFFILIIHQCNYRGVIEDYENVVDAILRNEFECEYYNKSFSGSPIKLYVFQNDLKKECV
jgi:hypothetical protein